MHQNLYSVLYVSGIVLRPELGGTRAIRVLLGDGLSHWIYTAAITFPFPLLALASSKEGELLLARFGFYCYQKAHAEVLDERGDLMRIDQQGYRYVRLEAAREGCPTSIAFIKRGGPY